MAITVRCPSCGASLQDEGAFCKYCGARLPEDVKRIRIENVAEMTRAETERALGERHMTVEEREMLLKERQFAGENRRRRARWIVPLSIAVVGVICILIGSYPLKLVDGGVDFFGFILCSGVLGYEIIRLISKIK